MPRFLYNIDKIQFDKAQSYLDKVSVVDSTKNRLKATVVGSTTYQVSLQKSALNEEILGFCSCMAFITNGQCKHIAAVLLKEKGMFFDDWNSDFEFVNNAFINPGPIILEDKASNEFEQIMDSFVYEQKRRKEDIETPEVFYSEKDVKINAPELIWYIIDFYEDYTGVKVEFSLQCQSRLSSGRLGKIKNVKIEPVLIRLLPDALDQEVLNQLCAFGRWEYSQSKNSSSFHNGDFYLHQNRDLFKKIIKTKRTIKRSYRYYDVDEDKDLKFNTDKARFRIEVDSIQKTAMPFIEIKEERFSYKDFDKEIYDNFLLKYDEFFEVETKDLLDNNLYSTLIEIYEKNLEVSNEQWNELQAMLIKNIPHHLFTGDKFNLKVETVKIYFELYLKWEDNSNHIRGYIYVPDGPNTTSLIELNYEPLENFISAFPAFTFNENTFLFESSELFKFMQYADESKLPVFFKKQKLKAASSFSMDVTSGINWLELNPKLDFNGLKKEINFRDILKRVNLKSNTIELSSGEIGIIPDDWIEKIRLIQKHAVITKDAISLHPAKALILDEFPELKTQKNIRLLKAELENFSQIKEIKEDKNFNGVLRPYQRLALGWFEFLERCRFGGCLADDMGLGKTIQMIAHLQKKLNATKGLKILIVCPKSLTGNWESEFALFAKEITVFNWRNKSLSKMNYDLHDVFMVSYQLLQRQSEFDYKFDYLIMDEAQMIKNSSSLTHKACAAVEAKHKYALTGTPVENHAGDMMSIFNIVIPGLFEAKKIKDPTILENFNFLRPFILRRTKDKVLKDLPAKTVQTIYCEQSPKERKEYLSYHVALREELEKKSEEKFSKLILLQVLTKLRQAASHLKLVDNATKIESSKMETLKELVSEIHDSGNKVIIFSQFTKLLALVKEELNLDVDNSSYLDGSTRDRDRVINDFKNRSELKTFLISIKAGGVGLNLTNASYCIILDPWWNPAVEAQAIDRIHRIGQKNPVFAYRLITKDTIEEKVHALQNTKRDLYNTLLESNEGFIKELKKSDIQFLLS
jgi:SNF2 family DNA or RNA helicase